MFVANDEFGNRIYAESYKGESCFCPVCGEEVRIRKGRINKPHFAHKQKTDCKMSINKDYKSEWHIRMQEYFPKENREYIFIDEDSGEIHIADVFLNDTNTVIEFQHSHIDNDEFVKRTAFHLINGRRIVWVFDESKENNDANQFGRFKYDSDVCYDISPYEKLCYIWMRQPRKCLIKGPDLQKYMLSYSVCVYTGTEGESVRRIVKDHNQFKLVTFSKDRINMSNNADVDSFFGEDEYWKNLKIQQYIRYKQNGRMTPQDIIRLINRK